eukprot:CAMPEP_0175004384 /NCGR_PEP_ID=MMETSP0005-20121125/4734_1 /TAXON_ID=420556 /ORGANISM="Ochromonas sp., Strain CCMP1393" /LENGTH=256 /DNA_ID=CAMNT_0016259525 /DNA_START=239 /DNA_END=1013 /DNA_ORIENTATION=+
MGEDDPEQFLLIAQHFSHFDAIKTFDIGNVSYATDFDVLMAILNEVKRRLQSMKESGKEGDSDKIDEERKSAPTSSSTRPAAAAQLSIKIPGVGSAGGGDTVGVDCSTCLGWRLPIIGWNRVTPHERDSKIPTSPRTPRHRAVRRSRSREISVVTYSMGAKVYVELMIGKFEQDVQEMKDEFLQHMAESTPLSVESSENLDALNEEDEESNGAEAKVGGKMLALAPDEIPDWQRDILNGSTFGDDDDDDDDDDEEE